MSQVPPVARSRLAAVSLGAIGVAIPCWWIGLFASDGFRSLFVAPAAWGTLRLFLAPDLALSAATSFAAVTAFRRPIAPLLAGTVCGAWGFATIATCSAVLSSVLRPLGAFCMVAGFASVCIACHALVSSRED
jgi:hypothetical protein